jgi:hypothetical protein
VDALALGSGKVVWFELDGYGDAGYDVGPA